MAMTVTDHRRSSPGPGRRRRRHEHWHHGREERATWWTWIPIPRNCSTSSKLASSCSLPGGHRRPFHRERHRQVLRHDSVALFVVAYPQLHALGIDATGTVRERRAIGRHLQRLRIVVLIPVVSSAGRQIRATNGGDPQRNVSIYGVGGIIIPLTSIKLIDLVLVALGTPTKRRCRHARTHRRSLVRAVICLVFSGSVDAFAGLGVSSCCSSTKPTVSTADGSTSHRTELGRYRVSGNPLGNASSMVAPTTPDLRRQPQSQRVRRGTILSSPTVSAVSPGDDLGPRSGLLSKTRRSLRTGTSSASIPPWIW